MSSKRPAPDQTPDQIPDQTPDQAPSKKRRSLSNKDLQAEEADRAIKKILPILDREEWDSDDGPDNGTRHRDDASWTISWAQKLKNASKSYHPTLFLNFLDEIVTKKMPLPKTVKHILSELDEVFISLVEYDGDEFESEDNPPAATIFDRVTSHIEALKTLNIYDKNAIPSILGWEKNDDGLYSMKESEVE